MQRPPTLLMIRGNRHIVQDLGRFEQHIMKAYSISTDRWSAELRAILKDDALDAFLSVPTADTNSYEAVKSAILVRAGIATHSRFQKFLQFNPRFNETAA